MTLEEFIIQEEGFRQKVYRDQAGFETIGVGHKLNKDEIMSGEILIGVEYVNYMNGISMAEVKTLLKQDLHSRIICVEEWVDVVITENQKIALISFVFNVGRSNFKRSTLLIELNKGNYAAMPGELRRWNKATVDGELRTIKGLINRRESEIKMWNGEIK